MGTPDENEAKLEIKKTSLFRLSKSAVLKPRHVNDDGSNMTLAKALQDEEKPVERKRRKSVSFGGRVARKLLGKSKHFKEPSEPAPTEIQRQATLQRTKTEIDPSSPNAVVTLNIGGQSFTTTVGTLTQEPESLLGKMILEGKGRVIDSDGFYFVDRDGKHFNAILNFLRNGSCPFPEPGTVPWEELQSEAAYYQISSLQQEMKKIELESYSRAQRLEYLKQKLNGDEELIISTQAREIERMRVELQRLQYENARFNLETKHKYYANDSWKDFAYNLLVVGVTGTGKSSSLNTLLDAQDNAVSGAQAQGTRGTVLSSGVVDESHFISYIDTQGLGADTSITDEMLLSHIMMSTESILQMDIINNILISFDMSARATPSAMANQLTLIELFSNLRESCFLCLTKWNTNSVMSEWNLSLRAWVRKWRRAKSIDKITEDPPCYGKMYRDYCNYLLNSMAANAQDTGAFAKMAIVLAFFESRVIWMYNLDEIQFEDKEDGELEPYVERMYNYYREQAVKNLYKGSTVIHVSDLVFLKSDGDTMMGVATRLIDSRDERIHLLDSFADDEQRVIRLKEIFHDMTESVATRVMDHDFSNSNDFFLGKIARLSDKNGMGSFVFAEDLCIIQ